MIAEIGQAALCLAAAFAVLQLMAGLSRGELGDLAAPAAYAHGLLAVVALLALVTVFQSVDLSVEGVIAGDDRRLPGLTRLAAVWSQPAGVMLLTAVLVALAGVGVALGGAPPIVLARLGGVGAALAAALLGWAEPFRRAVPAPTTGQGLAAALQVPLLAAAVPLAAAGIAASIVALIVGGGARRRFAGGAAMLFALSATAHAYASWHDLGTLDGAALPAVAACAVLAVAGRPRRLAATLLATGALLMAGVLVAGATVAERHLALGETTTVAGHALRLTALAPVAGANWTGVEATLTLDRAVVHPEWREYVMPREAIGRAATVDGVAITPTGVAPGFVRLRLESRPYLAWLWLGAALVVAGSAVTAARR